MLYVCVFINFSVNYCIVICAHFGEKIIRYRYRIVEQGNDNLLTLLMRYIPLPLDEATGFTIHGPRSFKNAV